MATVDSETATTAEDESVDDSRSDLHALKLLNVFFTREELASGSCTTVEGHNLLRQDIIDGIRSTSYA